jgi:hypothetical protein
MVSLQVTKTEWIRSEFTSQQTTLVHMISLKFSVGGITTDNSFRSSPEQHSKQVPTYLLALDCSCLKLSMSVRLLEVQAPGCWAVPFGRKFHTPALPATVNQQHPPAHHPLNAPYYSVVDEPLNWVNIWFYLGNPILWDIGLICR